MARCEEELCRNWTGSGCICSVLDLTPDIACGHPECTGGPCIYDQEETDHG